MTKAKKTILPMIIPAIVPLLKPQFDEHTPRQHSSPIPHWKSYEQEQEDKLLMHLSSQHCSLVPHWWSYEQ
ncbi:hypothetical protein pdam_00015094 [Pocillopora damicornis]|uniref:Uncharacterized protein n=1 Tax=Pocillopora damicornis TaxID=46731 RepID=A0A3M6UMJ5_POCDA|nr:hypothetical protein pdam_00015094 [Pocillopora damicornis]